LVYISLIRLPISSDAPDNDEDDVIPIAGLLF
jgi:hypothetical protein